MSAEALTEAAAVALFTGIVPEVHARHGDAVVEALNFVIDALSWLPLTLAPRDGSQILLAVAPGERRPGFICIGRWVVPTDSDLDQMGRKRRERFEASGGWWSAGKWRRPFDRPVLAWRPVPTFDFSVSDEAVAWARDRAKELDADIAAGLRRYLNPEQEARFRAGLFRGDGPNA